LMASAIANSSDIGFRLLRLFKVYGSGEAPHRLLPALVSGLAKGERVAISSGTQVLDFVYIDDVVEAMLRADAHCCERGGIATWNVATGRAHSVREFAEHVAAAMNADASLLGFGAIAMRKDDEPWLVGSPDLLRSELGWQPTIGLDEGVRAAVAALRRAQSQE
jgi:nucleoside-diphosphate-sugar epimerase